MTKNKDTVTYQFQAPRDLWDEWKTTVPREKSLDKRLIELIDADSQKGLSDTKPDVDERPDPAPQEPTSGHSGNVSKKSDKPDPVLEAIDKPGSVDADDALEAVHAAGEYLEKHGPASMREIVTAVMPDYPLGYDVPQLETGERYRGAWWRRIVKPGLRALPEVDYRDGQNDYIKK